MSAMKPCRACGQAIAKNAKTCPHCGQPNQIGTIAGLVILIAILAVALFGWLVYSQLH